MIVFIGAMILGGNLKVAIYLFIKYTVSQKQLQFIHTNFTITQNHVNNVKGLAWPKLMSAPTFGGTSLPPLTLSPTNQVLQMGHA